MMYEDVFYWIYVFVGMIEVNNAGVVLFKPTVSYTAEEFSFIMSTNFESAFHLSQLAHPLLKASGSGSIVFISSIAGMIGANNVSLYATSKGTNFFFVFFFLDLGPLGCYFLL